MFGIAATDAQIAREPGTAREGISRMLNDFQKRGGIAQSRGRIAVTDKPALRALASGPVETLPTGDKNHGTGAADPIRHGQLSSPQDAMTTNAGTLGRVLRAALGLVLLSLAFPGGLPLFAEPQFGYGAGVIGVVMLETSMPKMCPLCGILGPGPCRAC